MKIEKCECNNKGTLKHGMEDLYDQELELPFVNHQPGECKCVNDLKWYSKGGKKVALCSCCVMGESEWKK